MPTDTQKFERECLEAHNQFRAQHGCPPLKLSRTLSARSKEWAENLAKRKTMENSSGHNFGENLYMAEGIHVDGARPVKAWYDGIEDYDFEEAKFVQAAGYFTQVIWKRTSDLGVGVATNDKLTLVVTSYFPPGNVHGQFKENVPRIIDQENIKPIFSEESEFGSNLFGGTININIPNTLMSSTRNSKDFHDRFRSHDLTIPIEMISTGTNPRASINSDLLRSSAQITLKISNDNLTQPKYAAAESGNLAKKELGTTSKERKSITIKDMHYLPPPGMVTPKLGRRTSSSGRTMLFRESSNTIVGSKEPIKRQESRSSKQRNMAFRTETARKEQGRMMPPPRPPRPKTSKQEPRPSQELSLVHQSTSIDDLGWHEQPSLLYTTFSNIILGNQEQFTPEPNAASIRTGITRQDPISFRERDMPSTTLTGRLEPRLSKERDIVYRTAPSRETSRQEQTSANDRNLLHTSISNIVLESQDQIIPQPYTADIRPGFSRQNPISTQTPGTDRSRQEQNGELIINLAAKTARQEKRLSKDQNMVQRISSAAQTESQRDINANERKFPYRSISDVVVSNQEPSTRTPFRRHDSISPKERDLAHSTEITSQKQNKEMGATTTVRTQNLRQEPGPSKSPDMLNKTPPAHETERQQRTSENERKLPYRSDRISDISDIVASPLRRQDSISPKERDMARKTEIPRQVQNREMVATTTVRTQNLRQRPGASKSLEMLNKTSPVLPRVSINSELPKSSAQRVSQIANDNLAQPKYATTRKDRNSVTVKDMHYIPPPGMETPKLGRRTSSSGRTMLFRASSNIDVVSKEPIKRQLFQRQEARSSKERNMAFRTETVQEEQSRLMPPPKPPGPKTSKQEPRPSRELSVEHQGTSIDDFGRHEQPSLLYTTFSNIILGSQEQFSPQPNAASIRTGINRQDTIFSRQQDHRLSKDMLQRISSAAQTEHQDDINTNERKFPYRSISDIGVSNQEPSTRTSLGRQDSISPKKLPYRSLSDIVVSSQKPSARTPLRRQDSISPKERDMARKTEIARQEQNREMLASPTVRTQNRRQQPGTSKSLEMLNKTTPVHEAVRQRTSANDRKFLYKRASNIGVNSEESATWSSIPAKEIFPAHETERQQRASTDDRKFLYNVSNQEPSTRTPLRRQDSISPKERDMARKTEIARQEQNREMGAITAVRTQNHRQRPGTSKSLEMLNKTTPVHEAERQRTSANDRKFLYKRASNIGVNSEEPNTWSSIPAKETFTAHETERQQRASTDDRKFLYRQDSISPKERDLARKTEIARQEQNREMGAITAVRTQNHRQQPGTSKSLEILNKATPVHEAERQRTSANDRKFIYKRASNIGVNSEEPTTWSSIPAKETFPARETESHQRASTDDRKFLYNVSNQEPSTQTPLLRRDSISPKERDIARKTEIARQEQNREMRATPTVRTQNRREQPGTSKSLEMLNKNFPAHETERQQRASTDDRDFLYKKTSNIGVKSEEPTIRSLLRRQDSLLPKQPDLVRKTEITRQEQNREMGAIANVRSQSLKQEPGPSKSLEILNKTTPVHEAARQPTSANDRKFLYKRASNIGVSSEEPTTWSSIPAKERDLAHKTEISRQEQARETGATTSVRTQNLRQEPGQSKSLEMLIKTTPLYEARRPQRASANESMFLYKKTSKIGIRSEEPTARTPLRSQDTISPKEHDRAHNTETTTLAAQTARQEPGPLKDPDMAQKAFPVHATERQTSANKNLLESQKQTMPQQQSKSTKEEDMPPLVTALRNEIARQVKNKEIPPKTTLSIETSRKGSITSRTPGVDHVMALRKEIANQEHSREMEAKQTPRVEIGRQQPKPPKEHQDMGYVRQDFTAMGHRNVSQTKIPRPQTGKHDPRALSSNDLLQIKIPRSETGRQQPKAPTNKDVSQTKIPRPARAKREPTPFSNIDISHTKSSEVDGREEPTTSTSTKIYEPTTQTSRSTERLRKMYEFSYADKLFHIECLLAHNCYRAKHGSPPLQLCQQLTIYATKWAQELARMDKLLYSPTKDLGENIYVAAGIRITGDTPVKAWYYEVEDYDYKKSEFTPYTGHFTQVVWKDTRELGVGIIKTDKCCIVVASYFPPGNEAGQFKDNVLPSRGCICATDQRHHNNSSSNSTSHSTRDSTSTSTSTSTSHNTSDSTSNSTSHNTSDSTSNSTSHNTSDSRRNSTSITTSNTSSSKRLVNAGLLATAMAAALGGWVIYNKPFLH